MAKCIPANTRKLAFVDTETTGLDPAIHEILEFSVEFEDGTQETFKIAPQHIETADARALEINGYTPEEWVGALDPHAAAELILKLIGEAILIGHNIGFDVSFLRALLRREGFNANEVGRHCGDTVTLAIEHLVPRGLTALSLKDVMVFLGLEPEPDKHRAAAGALGAKAVWGKLTKQTGKE